MTERMFDALEYSIVSYLEFGDGHVECVWERGADDETFLTEATAKQVAHHRLVSANCAGPVGFDVFNIGETS